MRSPGFDTPSFGAGIGSPGTLLGAFDALPEAPGVYLFYGLNALPLYIGKANNLRRRILSHFSTDHALPKELAISQQVERIELKVHPLVLELTGKKEPADGLQAKFSVYHGCAAGLVFGRAAEDEFSDEVQPDRSGSFGKRAREKRMPAGARLVCTTEGDFSAIIGRLVRSLQDRATVSLTARGSFGRVIGGLDASHLAGVDVVIDCTGGAGTVGSTASAAIAASAMMTITAIPKRARLSPARRNSTAPSGLLILTASRPICGNARSFNGLVEVPAAASAATSCA